MFSVRSCRSFWVEAEKLRLTLVIAFLRCPENSLADISPSLNSPTVNSAEENSAVENSHVSFSQIIFIEKMFLS